jgi:hypothetical protein
MMTDKYQCFKFNESSLFDPQVGPAYNEDVYYDSKLSNGLNSLNSELKQVKVIKIMGIKIVDGARQKPEQFWYNPDTRIVYDYDLDFPIGRVKLDDQGIANREVIDKVTYYLIEELIDIPKTRI